MSIVHKYTVVVCVLVAIAGIFFMLPKRHHTINDSSGQHFSLSSLPAKAEVDEGDNFPGTAVFELYDSRVTIADFLDAGWNRIARLLIVRKKTSVTPNLLTRLGLILGDPELFWSGRAESEIAQNYWLQKAHSTLPVETKWRILKGWPGDDHSYIRWLLVAREWLLRPVTASDEPVTDIFRSLTGCFYETLALRSIAEEFLRTAGELRILPLHCLLNEDARQSMIMAATLINLGWSWIELEPLTEIPPSMNSVAAQWWLESGHPLQAWAWLRRSSDPFQMRIFEDAALAALEEPGREVELPFDEDFIQHARNNYRSWYKAVTSEYSMIVASNSDSLNVTIETLKILPDQTRPVPVDFVEHKSVGQSSLGH